jgi:hypothetical protein
MASNIFKKGMLCLAFAAALTGCGPKAPDQTAQTQPTEVTQKVNDIKKMDPAQVMFTLAADAQAAAEKHYHAYTLQRDFQSGKISQEDFQKGSKEDADFVSRTREAYLQMKYGSLFDNMFVESLKLVEAREKMMNPEPAPKNALPLKGQVHDMVRALIDIAAGQMAEDIKVAANTQPVGPSSQDPALQGTSTRQAIFPGGPLQYLTVLDASALKAGGVYSYTGKLSINGDLPENVTLNVNGKLVVNGNVSSGDKLSVKQPENTRTEKHDCWAWGYGPSISQPSNQQYHYGNRDNACTVTLPDGLKYKNDPEAAIHITGTAANNAGLYTNGGKIAVDGGRVAPAPTVAPTAPQTNAPVR